MKCDGYIRNELYAKVVLPGGTTVIQWTFEQELMVLVP